MYGDARGHANARAALADYFKADRGLNISADNIMITRGSQMAIYLASKILLKPDDKVAVGETNYPSANLCFRSFGASLVRIPVDRHGMKVHVLEEMLVKGMNIRYLYITSHHHHPTTVSLSPERRLRLLDLADIHDFAIIEDDYSYDFHYNHSPLLPIASADRLGSVIYIGSFSKSTAPAFRIGYLVAPVQVIDAAIKYRRFMDRQGDQILDLTLAELLNKGIIQRYKKKAIKAYRKRLDLFCRLFEKHGLTQHADYDRQEGGLAFSVRWKPHINLIALSGRCEVKELSISNGLGYNPPGQLLNSNRMGFAFLNESKMTEAFEIVTLAIEVMG
jgi:GntR family transcriptional regulator/MocR family aminotransferase